MTTYKKVGIWTYLILSLLSLIAGTVSELFIDGAVIGIFSAILIFGVITAFLNLSKSVIAQISNISMVFALLGFLGTTLNVLPIIGPWLDGFWQALVAFNVPVVIVLCLTRTYLLIYHKPEKPKHKKIWDKEN